MRRLSFFPSLAIFFETLRHPEPESGRIESQRCNLKYNETGFKFSEQHLVPQIERLTENYFCGIQPTSRSSSCSGVDSSSGGGSASSGSIGGGGSFVTRWWWW